MAEPSPANLEQLFVQGHARVLESWSLYGPEHTGLWWKSGRTDVVATPALFRLARTLPSLQEQVGVLLATELRFRDIWLTLQAARLKDFGKRQDWENLCQHIAQLGSASSILREKLASASLQPTEYAALELEILGAPADQSAATPRLLRILGSTAPWVEGRQGKPAEALQYVDPQNIATNWVSGRILQAPDAVDVSQGKVKGHPAVLSGKVEACSGNRMSWVLGTPWVTLLGVLVFTMEAWAAERHGGLQLELPAMYVQQYASPPQIQVIVTLLDGQEIVCGSLGEYCLRVVEALGMALVPSVSAVELDQRLGDVVARLLQAKVWMWKPESRTRYCIGKDFGFDCYRGEGHRHIFLGADGLSQTLRSVAVAWARERNKPLNREVLV